METLADKRTDSIVAARKLISPICQHLGTLAFFPFDSQDDFLDKVEDFDELLIQFFELMDRAGGFPAHEKERMMQGINTLVWNAQQAHLPFGFWTAAKDYRYADWNLDVAWKEVGEIQMAFEACRGKA